MNVGVFLLGIVWIAVGVTASLTATGRIDLAKSGELTPITRRNWQRAGVLALSLGVVSVVTSFL